ncbi:MAG TPA: M81 family metallopeptidase [Roseiflexaceae bacterium]|nr:M81 family metallopeptidase [Roseiflexaceae bacterium]
MTPASSAHTRRWRIALGGIAIESCTFSPLPSRLEDFHIATGAQLLERYPFRERFDGRAELVPLRYARSIPGGSVEAGAYQQMKEAYLNLLRANGPFDGVYLDFHGAMNVAGMDDAEGDWIAAVRAIVGDECLIAASYDLHGNISERAVRLLNMLTAYRTAPHVDVIETRERAMTMLVDCLEQRIVPQRSWIAVPVVLPGEKTSTEWQPGQRLYAELPRSDSAPGVLDASMLVGYMWADEPRASATIIVTGTDPDTNDREAERLAQLYWDARAEFQFGVPAGSIEECIAWALAADESCVFISDSGDNPTAGGAGDTPVALAALLRASVPSALVGGIADAPAVAACFAAGQGASVDLELGGKLDPHTSAPLPVRGVVRRLENGENREAVVSIGPVDVVISERRRPYHYVREFERLGLDALAYKIVVIKIGYLEPDLKRAAPRAFLALTPGAVDQAITRLPFARIARPIYPLDPDMTWSPRARRFE